jgi:RNA polymerase sigma-70 factor (sigma-E family)
MGEPSVVGPRHDTFDGFFRDQFERAARLAFLLTGEPDGAEDLAQEALSRVQPIFARLENPCAYLRTVLVNLCRRHRGRRARERLAGGAVTFSESVSPEARELLDVIDRLPARQKAVVVLRYYEDLSETQIAHILGCRPGTVKSLAARALGRLRQELES